jgi:predicted  nucleic acid-binding Zn-ribbon protein
MHWTTAKLIALDRVEGILAQGWARHSQIAFAEKAKVLRRELPPHIVAAYDHLKTTHQEPVVGVFQEKCGGCHAPLSSAALAHLSEEHEASRCEHCGRFIYVAGSRYVAPSGQAHQLTGGHGGK